MRTSSRVAAVASLALVLGVAAIAQPDRRDPIGRRPAAEQPGRFYQRYHISQGSDGKEVYLWGFDPDTAETVLVARERIPEEWERLDPAPGNFRDYFFADSSDGKRIFVWGYNPGQGHLRLVSSARAEDGERGDDRGRGNDKEREKEEERRREREREEREGERRGG